MCAQYQLHLDPEKLMQAIADLKILLSPKELANSNWHLFPKYRAPILRKSDDQIQLECMEFGLVPSWDKEKKMRFHNARVETIHEKPSFKKEFSKHHCLVPMSGFFEYIWSNEKENWLAKFLPKNEELLFAAGIYTTAGTFSVITMPPSKQILETGHDRSPLFLKQDSFIGWLENEGAESKDLIQFLRDSYFYPEWNVEKVPKKTKADSLL